MYAAAKARAYIHINPLTQIFNKYEPATRPGTAITEAVTRLRTDPVLETPTDMNPSPALAIPGFRVAQQRDFQIVDVDGMTA